MDAADDPHEASIAERSASTPFSSADDIGVPAGGALVSASRLGAPLPGMTTEAASTKSASSVAAQNTVAVGNPVDRSIASASALALSALTNVSIGPPNRPACLPVVTTTPCFAARVSAGIAAESPKAGASRRNQSSPLNRPRTAAVANRHSAIELGHGCPSPGKLPLCMARDSGEPPSGSDNTRGSV